LSGKHLLPSKIGSYFKRLQLEYARTDQSRLREIIINSRVKVIEKTSYDTFNNMYEHDVIIFVPADIIGELGFDSQKQIGESLRHDLNECAGSVINESFRAVHLELADESDAEYQSALIFAQQPQTNPDTLSFWTPGHLRLFISHRDTHKAEARELAEALSNYGVSAFVAHDTIEPMTTWQREIERGLETMEVMLAFVTDDFQDSVWTNQEVGYALGKGVPIISVKFQRKDPAGFIATKQALKGRLDRVGQVAPAIYGLLVQNVGQRERLQQSLVSAFASSLSWEDARDRFDRMAKSVSTLTDGEVRQIQAAYSSNESLHGAYYLKNHYNRLTEFMKRCTGNKFEIEDKELKVRKAKTKEHEIPF
jgi:hypothetical protein